MEDREKAKQAKLDARNKAIATEADDDGEEKKEATTNSGAVTETKTRAQLIEENRQKKLKDREARKKELEARKKKILEDRQKAKDSLNNN